MKRSLKLVLPLVLQLICWASFGAGNFNSSTWEKERVKYQYPEIKEQKQVEEKMQSTSPSRSWNWNFLDSNTFSVIGYVLAVVLLGYVILKISGIDVFNKNPKNKTLNISEIGEELPENIAQYDYSTLMQSALNQGNLRVATRFMMLLVWQQFDAMNLIQWSKDKTNRNYLAELEKLEQIYPTLKALVRVYEQVWYGKYPISSQEFQQVNGVYQRVMEEAKNS